MYVTLKDYKEDDDLRELVQKSDCLTELTLRGNEKNANEDKELIQEIFRYCSQKTTILTCNTMNLNVSADELNVFPKLSELEFKNCKIESDSILRFKDWCPNITKLEISQSSLSRAAFVELTSTERCYPCIKSVHLNLKGKSGQKIGQKMASLNKKFPSLESLNFKFGEKQNFDFPNQPNESYFKHLKTLSLCAYGDDDNDSIDKMFDYAKISTTKLVNFTLISQIVPDTFYEWIENSAKLEKLQLHCRYLCEYELYRLKTMPKLKELRLKMRTLHWDPKQMMELVSKQSQLKLLHIESQRNNPKIQYGEDFRTMFNDLLKQRRKMKINVEFADVGRVILYSEKMFCERFVDESDDGSKDDSEGDSDDVIEIGTNQSIDE